MIFISIELNCIYKIFIYNSQYGKYIFESYFNTLVYITGFTRINIADGVILDTI